MNIDEYLKIKIGSSFLINAGIVGFIKFLIYNNVNNKTDYIIDGQYLYVSKGWLEKNDISNMYVNTVSELLYDNTYLSVILKQKETACHLAEKAQTGEGLSNDDQKNLAKIYSDLLKALEKNSFKSAYESLSVFSDISEPNLSQINDLKAETSPKLKQEKYLTLLKAINRKEVLNVLTFKELMYSKINLFFENISFFLAANLKLPISECFKKDFYSPLIDSIHYTGKKTKRCIECSETVKETRSISFMLDTTDDIARKKSSYWNLKPDAFVCPVCAFLYTFVPLGFKFYGQDAVFINQNNDIQTMYSIMDSFSDHLETTESKSKYKNLFAPFTKIKIESLENKIHNVQVVVRSVKASHYTMSIIGADTIRKLYAGSKYLEKLENVVIKMNDSYLNIYDEVFDNILIGRSQHDTVMKFLKFLLGSDRSTNFLINVVYIQAIFKGDENVMAKNKKELIDTAYKTGIAMRRILTDLTDDKEIDNSLRSFVYRLTNAVSTGNRTMFIDSVIRIYTGKALPIPGFIKECMADDEIYKLIGQSFILGLKYSKYEKEPIQ
ncbi:MAG: Cas8a1 family CRISPR/Cas system-associated protein [Eubacteriales bacterium]